MEPDIAKVKTGKYKDQIVVIEYFNPQSNIYVVRLLDRPRPCLTFLPKQLNFNVNEKLIRSLYDNKINNPTI